MATNHSDTALGTWVDEYEPPHALFDHRPSRAHLVPMSPDQLVKQGRTHPTILGYVTIATACGRERLVDTRPTTGKKRCAGCSDWADHQSG